LYIPPENSKTGKGRRVVAPIKKRVDRIIASYKRVGNPLAPTDYLFMNPGREDRKHFVRQNYFARLKRVLIKCGLQDELDSTGTSINLYSGRHTYACWRLRYGDVPIHLLAKQMGTSVMKIEEVYGHIETEHKLDIITKSQGTVRDAGIILETPEILDDPV
jgi:integrase